MEPQDGRWEDLLTAAREAAAAAYAPYSGYSVGAALLTPGGTIHRGCNVENGAYPLGHCAERSAVAAAVVAGQREFIALALSLPGSAPATPCGGCRQVLHEFAGHLPILVEARESGVRRLHDLADLLPEPFDLDRE